MVTKFVEVLAERYTAVNAARVGRDLRGGEQTVFLLAYATLILNTDLHTPNNLAHRMTREQFAHNLRKTDAEGDPPRAMLDELYERVAAASFQPLPDHVSHVLKLERQLVGRHPVRQATAYYDYMYESLIDSLRWRHLVCARKARGRPFG